MEIEDLYNVGIPVWPHLQHPTFRDGLTGIKTKKMADEPHTTQVTGLWHDGTILLHQICKVLGLICLIIVPRLISELKCFEM